MTIHQKTIIRTVFIVISPITPEAQLIVGPLASMVLFSCQRLIGEPRVQPGDVLRSWNFMFEVRERVYVNGRGRLPLLRPEAAFVLPFRAFLKPIAFTFGLTLGFPFAGESIAPTLEHDRDDQVQHSEDGKDWNQIGQHDPISHALW
jgi:hypothetical protein